MEEMSLRCGADIKELSGVFRQIYQVWQEKQGALEEQVVGK